MKNKLSFAQLTQFLEGKSLKDFHNNDKVLVINRESIINETFLEDALKRDLEFGSVFLDVPNISSFADIVKDVLMKLKEKSLIGSGTYFYAANKPVHYYTEREIEAYEYLDNVISENFSEDFGPNFLKFPEIYTNIGEVAHVEAQHFHRIESVKRSSDIIRFVLETIKEKKLSPYERFLAAYDFTTSFTYNKFGSSVSLDRDGNIIEKYVSDNYTGNGVERDWRLSRTITNVLTTGHIVCVGYAELMALFCKELDIPVVSETIKSFDTKDREKYTLHQRIIVKLKDSKYNINGIYKSDPTADGHRFNDGLDVKRFAYHLVPLNKQFLNEESIFEFIAQNKLTRRDINNNKMGSLEALSRINNSGLSKKSRNVLSIRTVVDDLQSSFKNENIKNSLDGTYEFNTETEHIKLLVKENAELTDEDKKEFLLEGNEANKVLSENKIAKDKVYEQFMEDCNNTKEITPLQFKQGLYSVLNIVKPGYSKDAEEAFDYANWVHDINKEIAQNLKLPTSTFESYIEVDYDKEEIEAKQKNKEKQEGKLIKPIVAEVEAEAEIEQGRVL